MRKIIVSLLLGLLIYIPSFSQFIIYKTYEDYVARKGEVYEDYKGHNYSPFDVVCTLVKNGKKESVSIKEVWGFEYKGYIFRMYKKNLPLMLMNKGKICYYENGFSHLEMFKSGAYWEKPPTGTFSYFSKTINSELHPIYGDLKSQLKDYKTEYPDDASLFDCLRGKTDIGEIRPCIEKHEGMTFPPYDYRQMMNKK